MADFYSKIGNDFPAERGMSDLGMELDAVVGFGRVGYGSKGCRGGLPDSNKVLWQVQELVTVGHPDLEFLWEGGEEVVDVRSRGMVNFVEYCVAIFAVIGFDCLGAMDPRQFLTVTILLRIHHTQRP